MKKPFFFSVIIILIFLVTAVYVGGKNTEKNSAVENISSSVEPWLKWRHELNEKYGIDIHIPGDYWTELTPGDKIPQPTNVQWYLSFVTEGTIGEVSALVPSSYTQQMCPQDMSFSSVQSKEKFQLKNGEEIMICEAFSDDLAYNYVAFVPLKNYPSSVLEFKLRASREVQGYGVSKNVHLNEFKKILMSLEVSK
jgi:hypothetical protein